MTPYRMLFAALLSLLASASLATASKQIPVVVAHTRSLGIKRRVSNELLVAADKPIRSSKLKTLAPVLAASFCVAAIMYPLDLVRALQMANAGVKVSALQLLANFKKTHGLSGFFTQGLAPELARATWMRTVKFGLFPLIHLAITNGVPENKGTGMSKAVAAILTSVPEVLTIMPLEIAKISLQLDSRRLFGNSMVRALGQAYRDRGLAGWYTGYVGVQLRNAAWGAGYFTTISSFEKMVDGALVAMGLDPSTSAVRSLSQLASGFGAGVFGAVLNTPLDTVRSNVQKRILGGLPGATSFIGVGREIVAARGVTALYAGFNSKAVHLGGGGALMAYFIPLFKKLFANL